MFVKQEGFDLLKILKRYAKQNGQITYESLRKVFDLVGYQLNDSNFNLLVRFADEQGDGHVIATDLANQIIYAREIAP